MKILTEIVFQDKLFWHMKQNGCILLSF